MLINNPSEICQVLNSMETNTIAFNNELAAVANEAKCADVFNAAFSSAFTDETRASLPIYLTNIPPQMPPTTLIADGISCVIENIKLPSTAGVGQINSKLKKRSNKLAPEYLCLIFSQPLSTSSVPEEWKMGRVKSGSKDSPLNYRSISLTSVHCKIMEQVIYSQIMNFLE